MSEIFENEHTSDNEEFELFYGKSSSFSQFHPAKFTIDDVSYNCAEQYYMYQKASKTMKLLIMLIYYYL